MTIEYEQWPSGKCPVQAYGNINGLPFYFRSRGGHWKLSIANTPDGDPLDYKNCRVHTEEYNGIHRDDPQEFEGYNIQFGAGIAERGECIAFIQRAAGILMQETEA